MHKKILLLLTVQVLQLLGEPIHFQTRLNLVARLDQIYYQSNYSPISYRLTLSLTTHNPDLSLHLSPRLSLRCLHLTASCVPSAAKIRHHKSVPAATLPSTQVAPTSSRPPTPTPLAKNPTGTPTKSLAKPIKRERSYTRLGKPRKSHSTLFEGRRSIFSSNVSRRMGRIW